MKKILLQIIIWIVLLTLFGCKMASQDKMKNDFLQRRDVIDSWPMWNSCYATIGTPNENLTIVVDHGRYYIKHEQKTQNTYEIVWYAEGDQYIYDVETGEKRHNKSVAIPEDLMNRVNVKTYISKLKKILGSESAPHKYQALMNENYEVIINCNEPESQSTKRNSTCNIFVENSEIGVVLVTFSYEEGNERYGFSMGYIDERSLDWKKLLSNWDELWGC